MTATKWTAEPAKMLRKVAEHDAFERAARHRAEMVAEIQRRRDWGAWTPSDRVTPWDDYLPAGADVIDLTERFAPRCEPEPPRLDTDTDDELSRRVEELLSYQAPQWVEYATWGAILGVWLFAMIALCMLMAQ